MPRKPKAKLYLRFRMPDGKQSPYCPALCDHKSRIRPFWCLVKGVEELHRDGTYYRRIKRSGKWQWESLGNDANAAYAKLNVPRLLLVMPAAKNEAAVPTVKDGFRLDLREFLSHPAPLLRNVLGESRLPSRLNSSVLPVRRGLR